MIDPLLVFVGFWIALPILPIAGTWVQFLRLRKSGEILGPEPAVLLILVTASYFGILAGLVFPVALGPDYSSRRFTTIWISLGITAFLAVWSLVRGKRLRWRLFVSCALTTSVWLYAAIISAVV